MDLTQADIDGIAAGVWTKDSAPSYPEQSFGWMLKGIHQMLITEGREPPSMPPVFGPLIPAERGGGYMWPRVQRERREWPLEPTPANDAQDMRDLMDIIQILKLMHKL